MKSIILVIVGLILIFDVQAADPDYETKTGILFIPRGTINHKDAYINIKLLLNPDGTYRFLAATPEQDAKVYMIGGHGPAGGIVFYITDSGIHGLEAALEDIDSNAGWGCLDRVIEGTDGFSVGTGEQNTFDILAGCNEPGIAAERADNYRFGGYRDWFLPALDELTLLYFQREIVGNFIPENYWTSTEFSEFNAWIQSFANGGQSTRTKDTFLRVRPISTYAKLI